jgi:hypothetical protein
MMMSMNMFHEPFDMKEVVGKVKPGIEDEHIDEHLLNQLEKSELVLSASPVSIKR